MTTTALIRRAAPIDPFDRLPDGCVLGDRTFAEHRASAIRAARLLAAEDTPPDAVITGPALVLADDVYVSRRALRGFLREARARATPSRLCLPPSRLVELVTPLCDLDQDDGRCAFDVAWIPEGATMAAATALALGPSDWVSPAYREIPIEAPVPRYIFGRPDAAPFTFPLTSTVVMRVRHWVHVLRLSHLIPQVALLDRISASPVRSALRLLLSLRPSRDATLRALKARFVYRGRGAFIHPSATVEASILGDGVVVGPHAYVVGSVLGAGSFVEDRAHVNQSTLGPNTFVSRNSTVSACCVFGDTDACTNGVQACVISERSGLTSFARPLDVVPGGEVKVLDDGRPRSVGELPCGVAFGADVFVGADVVIAPGRTVPAGTRLVTDPARVLRRSPPPGGGLFTVRDGAAIALDDLGAG